MIELASASKVHKASLKAMLTTEAKARTALTAALAANAVGHPSLAAAAVGTAVGAAVLAARARARSVSHATFLAELAHAKQQALAAGDDSLDDVALAKAPDSPEDAARAAHVAASTATAFAVAAQQAASDGSRSPTKAAAAAIAIKLETIAATETAHAFNDERHRSSLATAITVPFLFKRWDATLDHRTCRVCRRLDSRLTAWIADFGGGQVPGKVHPNCRCIATAIYLPKQQLQAA